MKVLAVLLLAAAAMAINPLAEFRRMTPEKRATGVWAVLVAGSNSYSNYRHQSDICAMYQELHAMGIPDQHIIVLMYDDIAQNSQNPKKGMIINTPGGPDVYKGVPKDYTGKTVTADNFVRILNGEAPAGGSGKALMSNTNDHVFVFFSDHGGDDILAFPTGAYLTSKNLYNGIVSMSQKGLFGTLYITIEACEAGSMFYKYTYPPGVYITTASPIMYSSYAWQWDDTVRAYVSDVWSWYMLHFMMDPHAGKTLQDQFDYVESSMKNYSQPCQYGDITGIPKMLLDDFFLPPAVMSNELKVEPKDAVRAWDVSLETARRTHALVNSRATAEALKKEERVHEAIDAMAARLTSGLKLAEPAYECTHRNAATSECASNLIAHFRNQCGRSHDYLDSLTPVFWGMCGAGVDEEAVLAKIEAECQALWL